MLLARFVVEQRTTLNGLLDAGFVDASDARGLRSRRDAQFQEIERHPRVAVRVHGDRLQGLIFDLKGPLAESSHGIGERAGKDRGDLVGGQPAKNEHLRARKKRGVHFEGGVFRGRADEDDVAGFHARQEGVLLRLVEPVDLVDEDDRAPPRGAPDALGFRHDLADFLDPGKDRAEGDEPRFCGLGDDPRQRRLARARRPPEDDRLQKIALDGFAQRPARGQEILLADELVKRPRPHALRQRRRRRARGLDIVIRKQGGHESLSATLSPRLVDDNRGGDRGIQ